MVLTSDPSGAIRDPEQAVPSCPEEHRPGDESRHHDGGGAREDAQQLPGGRLCGVAAGWGGGEAQRPQEEGKRSNLWPWNLVPDLFFGSVSVRKEIANRRMYGSK